MDMDDDSGKELENDNEKLRSINKRVASKVEEKNRNELRKRLEELERKMEERNRAVQEMLALIKLERDEAAEIKSQLQSESDTGSQWKTKRRKKQRGKPAAAGDQEPQAPGDPQPGPSGNSTQKKDTKPLSADAKTNDVEDIMYTQNWASDEDDQETEEEEETQSREPKQKKPPPIVLREEGKLTLIRREAEANNIEITGCRNTKEGIKIFTKTANDFRKLRKLLEGKNVQAHTFCLPEEKPLKLVLRGIPLEIAKEEVENELKERGFPIISTYRMKRFKEEMPLILVNAEKGDQGKKIFDIKEVAGMRIKVEPKRKPVSSAQCFRCQMFGHVQYRCSAKYRCVRCAEEHPSYECPNKDKKFQAKCANCGGPHHAASRNCPEHPEKIKERKEEEKRKRIENANRREGTSYASAAKSGAQAESQDDINRFIQLAEEISRMLPSIKKLING